MSGSLLIIGELLASELGLNFRQLQFARKVMEDALSRSSPRFRAALVQPSASSEAFWATVLAASNRASVLATRSRVSTKFVPMRADSTIRAEVITAVNVHKFKNQSTKKTYREKLTDFIRSNNTLDPLKNNATCLTNVLRCQVSGWVLLSSCGAVGLPTAFRLCGIGVPWVLTGTHRCALMPRVASRQSANSLWLAFS